MRYWMDDLNFSVTALPIKWKLIPLISFFFSSATFGSVLSTICTSKRVLVCKRQTNNQFSKANFQVYITEAYNLGNKKISHVDTREEIKICCCRSFVRLCWFNLVHFSSLARAYRELRHDPQSAAAARKGKPKRNIKFLRNDLKKHKNILKKSEVDKCAVLRRHQRTQQTSETAKSDQELLTTTHSRELEKNVVHWHISSSQSEERRRLRGEIIWHFMKCDEPFRYSPSELTRQQNVMFRRVLFALVFRGAPDSPHSLTSGCACSFMNRWSLKMLWN